MSVAYECVCNKQTIPIEVLDSPGKMLIESLTQIRQ